ncbi:MAG: DNA translocase FtsK 4TM domain-containing protein [Gammaproteobacteria bacterium]|nr:DNA translocase FtsK 4TM domain-containing protein [Gammaproteobacteria bacterium]
MNKLREVAVICIVGLALVFFLALISFHSTDSSWTHAGHGETQNLIGVVGAWVSDLFFVLFGYVAFILPVLIIVIAIMRWRSSSEQFSCDPYWLRVLGLVVFFIYVNKFFILYCKPFSTMPSGSGGILGDLIEKFLMSAISGTGTTIFLLIGILSGLTLCLHISWFKVADAIGYVILLAVAKLWRQIPKLSWSKARSSEKASYLSDEKEDLLEVRPMLRAPSVLPRKNIPSQEENLVSFAPKKAEQKAEKVEKTPNSKPVSRSLSRGEEVLLSLDFTESTPAFGAKYTVFYRVDNVVPRSRATFDGLWY